MTETSTAAAQNCSIEFRLVEMPEGGEHHYAVISFRVEKLTGRLLDYGWLYHADKQRFCTQDVLYVGLGRSSARRPALGEIQQIYYDKLLPILARLKGESEQIVAAYDEQYQRFKRHLDLGGATFADYMRYQEDYTPKRLSERREVPGDLAKAHLGLKESLEADRNLLRSQKSPYFSPFYPPDGPPRLRFKSACHSKLKDFYVCWQNGRVWNSALGPYPDGGFSMVWRFTNLPKRPPRFYKQLCRKILKDFWFAPYTPDFLSKNPGFPSSVKFHGRLLAEIGENELAEILSAETGRKISIVQVAAFCSELDLKSAVKKGRKQKITA